MLNTGVLHTVLILLSFISVVIDTSPVPEEVTTELQHNQICEIEQWADCKAFLQENLSKDSIEYKQLQETAYPYDTPLGHAYNGHIELIQVLLHNNIPVNKKYSRWKETLLHNAALGGHYDLVTLLLTHGADIEVRHVFDDTPLHKAVDRYQTSTVKLLLDNGAYVNSISVFHETPIFLAVNNFDAPPKKTNVMNNDERFKTELEDIMKYVNVNITVELLLKYGADVNIPDNEGNTVLHIAAEHGKLNVMKLLIERRANININAINNKHQTPLHKASESNNVSVVKYLLEIGCNKTITDSYNKTALDIAEENKFIEVIDLLCK